MATEDYINKIVQGDCLEVMKNIDNNSIDMILCDLPYGVLNKSNKKAEWDSVIPFKPLWEQYLRIIKNNGVIALMAQGMFTAELMLSQKKLWRYNLIWKKGNRISGFLNANKQPLRNHEDILVFYKQQPTYNPQMTLGEKCHTRGGGTNNKNGCYGKFESLHGTEYTNNKFPISVLNFNKEHSEFLHSSQKPVALFEYLIKTYTNENNLILDNCAGSGTTGVACINTKRNYILIEKELKYCKIAEQRIDKIPNTKLEQFEVF